MVKQPLSDGGSMLLPLWMDDGSGVDGLSLHVESDAQSVVALAQVAHGLQRGVAAECCGHLHDLEQLGCLEEECDAVRGALGVAVEGEEGGLHGYFVVGLVVGIGTSELLACEVDDELSFLAEGGTGVDGVDAECCILRGELFLDLCCHYFASGLGEEVA